MFNKRYFDRQTDRQTGMSIDAGEQITHTIAGSKWPGMAYTRPPKQRRSELEAAADATAAERTPAASSDSSTTGSLDTRPPKKRRSSALWKYDTGTRPAGRAHSNATPAAPRDATKFRSRTDEHRFADNMLVG